jgi:hypothetical protein
MGRHFLCFWRDPTLIFDALHHHQQTKILIRKIPNKDDIRFLFQLEQIKNQIMRFQLCLVEKQRLYDSQSKPKVFSDSHLST